MPIAMPDGLKAVIDDQNIAHLGTVDPDGAPQVSAAWVMRDGELIVLTTVEGRRKVRNMRYDGRVAVSISPAGTPNENWSIQGRVVEMRHEDADEVFDRFVQKYFGQATSPMAKSGLVRVTVLVEVTRVANNIP